LSCADPVQGETNRDASYSRARRFFCFPLEWI
jgi:hypothetical protein